MRTINCPAGEDLSPRDGGLLGCRCRIEHINITDKTAPTTLAAYCFSEYTECPTWRTARETEWKDREEAKRLEGEVMETAEKAGEA